MLQTNPIMEQQKINFMNNKKEGLVDVSWEKIVSDHVAYTV